MTQGFSRFEAARLFVCLDRLTPHLQPDCVAIAGSIGIQVGLDAR
jgi:hypothetical protein